MKTVRRTAALEEAWREYVSRRSDAQPFHRLAWARVLAQGYGFGDESLMALDGDRRVRGILPLFRVRRPIGRPILLSAPHAAIAGPLADGREALTALVDAARDAATACNADYIEIRGKSVFPGTEDWHSIGHYAVFEKPLPNDPACVETFIPRKQRAEVRKARKAGMMFVRDADTARFYRIYARSTHRLGSPVFPAAHARAILDEFGEHCEILTAELDGRPVGSLLTLYHCDRAMPYYAGGLPLGAGLTAFPALYAEAMASAIRHGAKRYDFGRSISGTGAFAFKRNFGFEPTPLDYRVATIRAGAPPDLRPDNPRLKPAVTLWKRLPAGLVDKLGPYLSRQVV